MIEATHFATFGSSQLDFTNLNPMKVAVKIDGATEDELRAELQRHPFNNRYCTTYPMSMFKQMHDDWGLELYNLKDL